MRNTPATTDPAMPGENGFPGRAGTAEHYRRQLEAVCNNATVALFIMDEHQHCTYMNPAAEELTGYRLAEVQGRPLHEVVHHTRPDGTPYPLEECPIDRAFPERNQVQGEETFVHKDGHFYPVAFTASPIREGGAVVGTIIEVRGIAEEKQAEATLHDSEELARLIVESATDFAIFSTDLDGRITSWNSGAAKLFACAKAEAIGRDTRSLFTPEDREAGVPEREMQRAIAHGKAEDERWHLRRDGSRFWASGLLMPLKDESGGTRGFLKIIRDLTDRERAEAALRESEQRFRLMADSIDQMIWVTRPDGYHEYYNKRWYEYTGMPEGATDGEGWNSMFHLDDRERACQRWRHSLETGEPYEIEYRLRHASGEYRWVLGRARPLRDEHGTIVQWFGTCTDIHDAKLATEERERLLQTAEAARAEAEAANRMKDEFLATLSHELRTPLNAILGWARILRSGKIDGDDLAEGLEAIERNSTVQAQLIEDLLDISRIISGNLRLDVQRVNLSEVIEAAIAAVMPAAEAKGIRVTKVLDSLAGPVSGDPARLQQIVWNLLSNAVKFTPKGGKVQVLLERVNSHVEVSVIDTGMGIRPEFLPHVFERFSQADGSTTRRYGGLGLGLSIVKQLTEMHGGTVRAKSPGEGQGATFTVMLPITVVHPDQPEKARPKEHAPSEFDCSEEPLTGIRVLVVDDEEDARTLIERVLSECHADVALASSVPEALKALKKFKPHVLVSDIGMPEQDGYDLIRQVRTQGHTAKELPAAALTAFARSEDRKRALLAGFQTHVAKPVDPSELMAVVASLAGRTGGT